MGVDGDRLLAGLSGGFGKGSDKQAETKSHGKDAHGKPQNVVLMPVKRVWR